MQFEITTQGYAAAFNAGSSGPKIEIPEFRLGSAYGYTPSAGDSALHGSILYTGTTSGYSVIDSNTCEYVLRVGPNVGTFDFGEIGLYMPDGTMFALQALTDVQRKIAQPLRGANEIIIRARLVLTNLPANINFVVQNITTGTILETVSFDTLLPPTMTAGVNAFIVHSNDDDGNTIFAIRKDGDFWDLSTHKTPSIEGSVLTSTQTSVQAVELSYMEQNFPLGRYILRVMSGSQKGIMRLVSNVVGNVANLYTPLPSTLVAGVQFQILQSDTSLMGTDFEEVAAFYQMFG